MRKYPHYEPDHQYCIYNDQQKICQEEKKKPACRLPRPQDLLHQTVQEIHRDQRKRDGYQYQQ